MASDDAKTLQAQHALMLKAIANRLEGEFGVLFTRDTLQHYVDDSYAQLSDKATVQTHLPAFVERFAVQRLKALTKINGTNTQGPVDVLFICERNDALSQMAAALFNAAVGDRAHAQSAGTAPAGELLEEATLAMHEIDLDLVDAFPKPLSHEIEQASDLIVTLDAHDDIEILDGKQYRAWRLTDRRADGLDGYRATRDELNEMTDALIAEMLPSGKREREPPLTPSVFVPSRANLRGDPQPFGSGSG
jgi:protein-tyrosine-phosphatase